MKKQNKRLLSLDALRGFDMFFIMGGSLLLASLAVMFPDSGFCQELATQMKHVEWDGLTHHDTIFPLFLFIAGISFPFSLQKQRESGKKDADIYKKIITRGLKLVLLGVIYNGLLSFDFAHQRYASVLGRIGLAWMFGALIFVNTRAITRAWITAALLVGYWLLMAFVPAPDGGGAGVFTMEGSLAGYIDRMLLPGRLNSGIHDPEGILSLIPAIGTALLGMFTGEFIKMDKFSDKKKVVMLVIAGAVLLVVGLLWSMVFPINKNLWTSSFVCVVGAYSVWMFALFFYVVDVLEYRKWTFFFKVIGVNSITIYLAQKFVNYTFTSNALFGGVISWMPEAAQPFVSAIGYIAVCWGSLYFLYRQKIFLKV
jgi:predicted acyltransferase